MEKFFERFCDFCCVVVFFIGFFIFSDGEYTLGTAMVLSFWSYVVKNKKIERLEKEILRLNFQLEDKDKQISELRNKENQ